MKNLIAILMVSVSLLWCANTYATQTKVTPIKTKNVVSTNNTKPTPDQAFLIQNKKKTGIVTLSDGLQYKILTKGNGPKPKETDSVTVNYAGTLINGTEFDSSYKRGTPATFPVNGVIPGWTEALQLMPVGSTWMLYIPAKLAYGERGAPPVIGQNKTLIFKVELLHIN